MKGSFTMTRLTSTAPKSLPAASQRPAYDRSNLTTVIAHFSVGGFHTAQQTMYLNRLMNAGQVMDWAICGVGVLPGNARMKEVMDG